MISLIAVAPLLGGFRLAFSSAPEMADEVPEPIGLAASIQINGRTSSEGGEQSPRLLDPPQKGLAGGGMSSQGPDGGGAGITPGGDAPQVAIW